MGRDYSGTPPYGQLVINELHGLSNQKKPSVSS